MDYEEDEEDETNFAINNPSGEIHLDEGGEDETEDEGDDGDDGVVSDEEVGEEGENEEKPRISLKGVSHFCLFLR